MAVNSSHGWINLGVQTIGPQDFLYNRKFPPDDLFGGNCFKNRMIRGPAVRGRAGGCTGTATAYNSGFTRRSLRSLGLSATRSSVTAVAEDQRRNRLCPSRRFVNPRAVIRNGGAGRGAAFLAAPKAKVLCLPLEGGSKRPFTLLEDFLVVLRVVLGFMCIGFRCEPF